MRAADPQGTVREVIDHPEVTSPRVIGREMIGPVGIDPRVTARETIGPVVIDHPEGTSPRAIAREMIGPVVIDLREIVPGAEDPRVTGIGIGIVPEVGIKAAMISVGPVDPHQRHR